MDEPSPPQFQPGKVFFVTARQLQFVTLWTVGKLETGVMIPIVPRVLVANQLKNESHPPTTAQAAPMELLVKVYGDRKKCRDAPEHDVGHEPGIDLSHPLHADLQGRYVIVDWTGRT